MFLPNSKTTRLIDAAVEPLSLDEAKLYLRVDPSNTAEDVLISDMITAARLECENIISQTFITTTWQMILDFLPISTWPFGGWSGSDDGAIRLPMPPLVGVTSIQYIDQSGVTQVVNPNTYRVSPGTPGRIIQGYGTFFPISQPVPSAVNIVYTAGYGPDATHVPKCVKQAIRLLVAHYHRHRTTNAEVPDAVYNLLNATS